MKSLAGFLKPNKIEQANVFYAASKSFVDEKGEPLQWELKAITSDQDAAIRSSSYKTVAATGKNGKPLKGQTVKEFQAEQYTAKLAAACVVFPDLMNAELQDSYHVKDAISLLRAMLNPGELSDLLIKTQELCGFDAEMEEELVEEAKN